MLHYALNKRSFRKFKVRHCCRLSGQQNASEQNFTIKIHVAVAHTQKPIKIPRREIDVNKATHFNIKLNSLHSTVEVTAIHGIYNVLYSTVYLL